MVFSRSTLLLAGALASWFVTSEARAAQLAPSFAVLQGSPECRLEADGRLCIAAPGTQVTMTLELKGDDARLGTASEFFLSYSFSDSTDWAVDVPRSPAADEFGCPDATKWPSRSCRFANDQLNLSYTRNPRSPSDTGADVIAIFKVTVGTTPFSEMTLLLTPNSFLADDGGKDIVVGLGPGRVVGKIGIIPEPSTALLLSAGIAGLAARRRRAGA